MLWGESQSIDSSPPAGDLIGSITPVISKAKHFYFNEKFVGCTFAQNLAKANIKKAHTDDTLDPEGRFKAFKLDYDSKNAQLQCFELFPPIIKGSNHGLESVHREGYRLALRSLDFMEKYPDEHQVIIRLGIDCVKERLSQTEHYQLNTLLVLALTERGHKLSAWEQEQLKRALADLALDGVIRLRNS